MEEVVENDWKKMQRLTAAGWALVGVGVVLLAVGFLAPTSQSSHRASLLGRGSFLWASAAFLLLWAARTVPLGQVERLKRKNDLVTYRRHPGLFSVAQSRPVTAPDSSRAHPHLAIAAENRSGNGEPGSLWRSSYARFSVPCWGLKAPLVPCGVQDDALQDVGFAGGEVPGFGGAQQLLQDYHARYDYRCASWIEAHHMAALL